MAKAKETPAQKINIEVNVDLMTIGDLDILSGLGPDDEDYLKTLTEKERGERARARAANGKAMRECIDRIVVGGIRHLPISMWGPIQDAVAEALKEVINPTDAEGKN